MNAAARPGPCAEENHIYRLPQKKGMDGAAWSQEQPFVRGQRTAGMEAQEPEPEGIGHAQPQPRHRFRRRAMWWHFTGGTGFAQGTPPHSARARKRTAMGNTMIRKEQG